MIAAIGRAQFTQRVRLVGGVHLLHSARSTLTTLEPPYAEPYPRPVRLAAIRLLGPPVRPRSSLSSALVRVQSDLAPGRVGRRQPPQLLARRHAVGGRRGGCDGPRSGASGGSARDCPGRAPFGCCRRLVRPPRSPSPRSTTHRSWSSTMRSRLPSS